MDPSVQQAQQDITDFLNGTTSGADAQAKAQAAQGYINWATKPIPEQATPAQKAAAQLQVQNAREAWQATQNAQSEAERLQIAQARDQTAKDIAAGRVQSADDVANIRGQYQSDIAAGRNQTSRDVAGIKAGSSIDVADIRAGATTGAASIRAGASEQVAQTNAAARIAAIQQKASSDLQALDKKFEDNLKALNANEALKKDYYAFTNQLQIIRDEHLQQAMAIRQEAVTAQQQEFDRPFKEASAQAETLNAQTNAARQAQETKYQQANLQLGLAKDQATQAEGAINSGVKLGVAPPMALVKAQFAPFQMAQQVLQQLANSGQIDPSRIPDALGIQPQTQQSSAPDQSNNFSPDQSSPDMNPQAAPPPLPPPFAQSGLPEGSFRGAPPPMFAGAGA